jgi:putative hydrolase of the HAD superfamily
MAEIALLLWDVGGVLLSDGWDRTSRERAAQRFGLPLPELERRHRDVAREFESGQLTLEEYLTAVVFTEPRPFSPEEFIAFLHGESHPYPEAIALARRLRAGGRYVMATLNNESRELNRYRVRTFGLRDIFHAFFSSGETGRLKPDPGAYELALHLTQRDPEESLLLDDRDENLRAAERLGLKTLKVEDPRRLAEALARLGVHAGGGGEPWN